MSGERGSSSRTTAPHSGFGPNPGVRTGSPTCARRSRRSCAGRSSSTGAGRTDAGVHAWGQVVSGDLPADTDLADLSRRVNKLCAPAIAVRDAAWVDGEFDARFSASWRHYRYDVWNAPSPNPLLAGRAWFVPQPLAVWAMQAACDPLIGEHDFTSFCRAPKVGPKSPSRRSCGACCRRAGASSSTPGTCASRSGRMPSAIRWSARSSARSSTSASARRRPATSAGSSSPATGRPPARSPRRTASCCGRSGTAERSVRLRYRPDRADIEGQVRHDREHRDHSRHAGGAPIDPDEIVGRCARRGTRRTHPGGSRRRRSRPARRVHGRRPGGRRPRRPRVDRVPDAWRCSRRSAPCATSTSRTARRSTSMPPADVRHLVCELLRAPCRCAGRGLRHRPASARRRLRLRSRRLALRHRRPLREHA